MKHTVPVAALLLLFLTPSAVAQMSVHHINVGQGDATLLEFKTAAVMIDAGGSRTNEARDHLVAYLDAFFARRADLDNTLYSLIATHPHADHTQYIGEILNRYRVRNFVDNGETEDGGGVDDLQHARAFVEQKNLEQPGSMIYNRVDAEDIGPGGYKTQWFRDLKNSPSNVDITFLNGSRDCENPNNDSLVVLVKYKTSKILITGDAEWHEDDGCTAAIPRMLGKFAGSNLLNVDVYKACHHGSPNGTNEAFLTKLSPKISVVSAGFRDDSNAIRYGHPRKSVIDQLVQFTSNSRPVADVYGFNRGAGEGQQVLDLSVSKAVYCTCWDGDIVISRTATSAVLTVAAN